jgi:hypothetical protein
LELLVTRASPIFDSRGSTAALKFARLPLRVRESLPLNSQCQGRKYDLDVYIEGVSEVLDEVPLSAYDEPSTVAWNMNSQCFPPVHSSDFWRSCCRFP